MNINHHHTKHLIMKLKTSLFFLLLLGSIIVRAAKKERPNVILIMTDDQGYGDLGCHGNPVLKTPNLDKLYSESVRFTDFHVSSFCTPTRAALMTGNYPGYTGAFRTSSGRTMMHHDEKTLGNLFKENGYTTGMVGKWHLGDNAPHRPSDRGFEDVLWHRCGGIGQLSDYWGNTYFNDTYDRNGAYEKFEGYCTDVWFRESIKFIEKNKEKPFFLYLAPNAPHGPYRVGDEWSKRFKNSDNEEVRKSHVPAFFGMIENIDYNMGILEKKLQELGLRDNTILIFMTDNGTAAGQYVFNAGMKGKKSSIYDGGHRVPFFIRYPKGNIQGGKDIDVLAAHIDVLPTLADLCNLKQGKEYKPDGISLKDVLLKEKKTIKREVLFTQFHGGIGAVYLPKPWENSVVMTKRWRLLKGEELYDMVNDPGQSKNVAAEHPEVVKELREKYLPYWEHISPRMTPVSINVGTSAEKETELTSQDWYFPYGTGNPPWMASQAISRVKKTGPWNLDVKKAGKYLITLRERPAIASVEIPAIKATIKIAGMEKEKPFPKGNKEISFEIDLPKGETQLITNFYNEKGETWGAYFTEVKAL